MWALLIIVGAAGIGYLAFRKPKAAVPAAPIAAPTFSETVENIAKAMPSESISGTFIHKETGEKVRIVAIEPNIDSGEYTIQWPSGAIGKIHKPSLASWFTEV